MINTINLKKRNIAESNKTRASKSLFALERKKI